MPAAALNWAQQARGPRRAWLGEGGSGGEAALNAQAVFCIGFFLLWFFFSSLSLFFLSSDQCQAS